MSAFLLSLSLLHREKEIFSTWVQENPFHEPHIKKNSWNKKIVFSVFRIDFYFITSVWKTNQKKQQWTNTFNSSNTRRSSIRIEQRIKIDTPKHDAHRCTSFMLNKSDVRFVCVFEKSLLCIMNSMNFYKILRICILPMGETTMQLHINKRVHSHLK